MPIITKDEFTRLGTFDFFFSVKKIGKAIHLFFIRKICDPRTSVNLRFFFLDSGIHEFAIFWTHFFLGASVGISDKPKAKEAIKWLQDMGDILYFDKYPTLSDTIVLDPNWMIDVRLLNFSEAHSRVFFPKKFRRTPFFFSGKEVKEVGVIFPLERLTDLFVGVSDFIHYETHMGQERSFAPQQPWPNLERILFRSS